MCIFCTLFFHGRGYIQSWYVHINVWVMAYARVDNTLCMVYVWGLGIAFELPAEKMVKMCIYFILQRFTYFGDTLWQNLSWITWCCNSWFCCDIMCRFTIMIIFISIINRPSPILYSISSTSREYWGLTLTFPFHVKFVECTFQFSLVLKELATNINLDMDVCNMH